MGIEQLLGEVLTHVEVNRDDDDKIIFTCKSGKVFKMYHSQDCCESVTIEDINGDLQDLLGHPILMAEETSSNEDDDDERKDEYESYTWTFYKLATIKAYVTLRWYGTSNGYYSESVDFEEMPNECE